MLISGRGKRAIDDHFDPDSSLQAELSRRKSAELLEHLAFERLDVHYFTCVRTSRAASGTPC